MLIAITLTLPAFSECLNLAHKGRVRCNNDKEGLGMMQEGGF